ncbi:hypothetical protein L6241_00620 [Janibacter sp. Y6]
MYEIGSYELLVLPGSERSLESGGEADAEFSGAKTLMQKAIVIAQNFFPIDLPFVTEGCTPDWAIKLQYARG